MIKNIFWDIDETLIHTLIRVPDQNHISFFLEDGGVYYTIFRPCAKSLIDFSRDLVGKDNVYILTSSTTDYANEINRLGEFGFERDHIIAREDISNHRFNSAYGASHVIAHALSDRNNVLIDNLAWRHNMDKMDLIGITEDRYFKIRDYYGVDFPSDTFESDVINFLNNKYNEKPNNPITDDGNG